jgi:hypothetical protein
MLLLSGLVTAVMRLRRPGEVISSASSFLIWGTGSAISERETSGLPAPLLAGRYGSAGQFHREDDGRRRACGRLEAQGHRQRRAVVRSVEVTGPPHAGSRPVRHETTGIAGQFPYRASGHPTRPHPEDRRVTLRLRGMRCADKLDPKQQTRPRGIAQPARFGAEAEQGMQQKRAKVGKPVLSGVRGPRVTRLTLVCELDLVRGASTVTVRSRRGTASGGTRPRCNAVACRIG